MKVGFRVAGAAICMHIADCDVWVRTAYLTIYWV